MSNMRCVVLIASCAIASCAGNGEGLDANGRPLTGGGDGGGGGGGAAGLTPDLKSIQDNVFTPICTQCHQGAAAPLGLRLDEASSFAMLVNTPSVEVSSLNRVTPGDPDNSYLIQKLEGRATVGAQMPLGQPPLPASTISVIRQWIANGAPNAQALTDVMPMQVRAVAPTPGEMLNPEQPEILLEAAGTLDAATLTNASVALVRSGGDGSFGDVNDVAMAPVQIEVRSLQPTVIALRLADGNTFVPDRYQLTLASRGAQPVRDGEGLAIGDFVLNFSVGGTL
jgi:hypothetical protein